ncbi:hypothetical protein BCR32DRAFT_295849 [Anaeromyces robustus]|uniref:Uncharacterized protein n=1 Tax=Anaeromyces robustus TaxID=1754192 RepID=A0A1Y1WUL8_9FUNG|nr:hypothetical protein BCR32DRAFT_295849 [Anaeromyces robustus]|eukprot:ORX77095.1 hypothetical protein BCR32DRAFT_295849 [Anaeromyces robustus]
MENLEKIHYIKERELPAINHIFYDNSDKYRIKKRYELYSKPYDKDAFKIYSTCTLKNNDIINDEKNINSTFRRDYTRKNYQRYIKENNDISKEVKDIFTSSHIDFLQDFKKDKSLDLNDEKNSKQVKEKDYGLSRCYDKACLDNDTDEVYKNHFLSIFEKDYTRKPLPKREPILNKNLNKFGALYRDNEELKKKNLSTYENDYYAKTASNEPYERSVPANTQTHFKLEDYNCDIENPYATEVSDNYKEFPVNRVIGEPDHLKYHFITNPDYKDNPFKSSMKNDFPEYDKDKYHKETPCKNQNITQFDLGYDTNDNHTLYKDTYVIDNDKIKELRQTSKNIPNHNTVDNVILDTEGNGYDNITTTHRHDFKNNTKDKTKAYNDSRHIFDDIKEISTCIPLNITWENDQVKESLMHNDYTTPKIEEKDKFKRVNPKTYDTNPYLKTNNKLGENDNNPKLTTFQSDYVNYPNKYKYNPRRPLNSKYDHGLFKNDIYNDENKPGSYRTSYRTDYQKIENQVKTEPLPMKTDFNTTLNEIFPKEVRTYPLDKESVTHNNFNLNAKDMPFIKKVNKQDVEYNYVDFIEHSNVGDSDNKKISIAHSSYIAPEITIDRAKMTIPLRNLI